MVIGGSEIYALALPRADRLYLTHVENSYQGDAWFPPFDREQWRVIASEKHAADEKNSCDYRFVTYERK
jgi:dihydrofolate reductase